MKLKDYIIGILAIAFVAYVLLNQSGCIGKTFEKEVPVEKLVYVTQFDTITKPREPVENVKVVKIEIPVPVEDTSRLGGLVSEYEQKIQDTQDRLEEYKNALSSIEGALVNSVQDKASMQKIIDSLLLVGITQKEYKDTFETEDYKHWYGAKVEGTLEEYSYGYEFYNREKPKEVKDKSILFGFAFGTQSVGRREPTLIYAQKNIYIGGGYDLEFNKPSVYAGLKFNLR